MVSKRTHEIPASAVWLDPKVLNQGNSVARENTNAGTAGANADQGGRGEGTDQEQGDPLAKLAAALLTLSPADRAKLAAMLAGHQGGAERTSR